MGERCPYPALEPLPLSQGERVCLGDDRNHVDLIVNGLHELDVQGLQAARTGNRRSLGCVSLSTYVTFSYTLSIFKYIH